MFHRTVCDHSFSAKISSRSSPPSANQSFHFYQLVLPRFLQFLSDMADQDEEYYGYYYGEDEDRGLLDPAWERQQKKVTWPVM